MKSINFNFNSYHFIKLIDFYFVKSKRIIARVSTDGETVSIRPLLSLTSSHGLVGLMKGKLSQKKLLSRESVELEIWPQNRI